MEVKRAEGSSFSSGSLVCNAGHRERSTIDRGKARSRREREREREQESDEARRWLGSLHTRGCDLQRA